MTAPAESVAIVEETQATEPGNHDVMSHYAKKDDIMRALVDGVAIRALCGKYWVPNKDPERYPVCPTCQEILNSMFPEA